MHDQPPFRSSVGASRSSSRRRIVGGLVGASVAVPLALGHLRGGNPVARNVAAAVSRPLGSLERSGHYQATPTPGGLPDVFPERVATDVGNQEAVGLTPTPNPDLMLGNKLGPGMSLVHPFHLRAENGPYSLRFEADGRLHLRALWGESRWSESGRTAIMQEDGNFVLYDHNNQPVWASNTGDKPGGILHLRDDGNLVVAHPNIGMLWESDTALTQESPEEELIRRITQWKLIPDPPLFNRVKWDFEHVEIVMDYASLDVVAEDLQPLHSEGYDNCSAVPETESFNSVKETVSEVTWNNTRTWNVGASFSLKIPIGALPGGQINASYQVASAEGGRESERLTRSKTQSLTIPAQTHVEAEWSLLNQRYETPFMSRIIPTGAVVTTWFAGLTGAQFVTEYRVDEYLLDEWEKSIFGYGLFDAIVGTREEFSKIDSPAQCT